MKRVCNIMLGAVLAAAAFSSCGMQRAVSGNQDKEDSFAFALFNTVGSGTGQKENILVSPYSVGMALGMLEAGAAGETAAELINVLDGFDWTAPLPSDKEVSLNCANSAWLSDRYTLRDTYVQKLEDNGTYIRTLDFSDKASPALVNRWCSENTAGKINEIVDSFSPQDVLMLVNALHFKAAWDLPFSSTGDDIFIGTAGKEEVPFMYRNKYSRYAAADGVKMVELPFEGGNYAMYVIAPEKGMPLSGNLFSKLFSQLQPEKVKLEMPEFKVEADASLKTVLQRMGIRKAFSPAADLSGIGEGPLTVSDVAQKTYIDVNKDGCEAAAVTSIMVGLTSVRPSVSIEMKVDRPFYYIIADIKAEHLLFIGKMNHIR